MATIMIIDDEPSICMILEEVIKSEGHKAITARDGSSALEALKNPPYPDLIMLDLYMPCMSGREVIYNLKKERATCNIPVILITGCIPEIHAFPPRDLYQGYIAKPFEIEAVTDSIQQILQNRVKEAI